MKPLCLLLLCSTLYAQREHLVRWTPVNDNFGRYGTGIVVMGDLDKDGVADYAIGGPMVNLARNGAVEILSGATGKLLRRWDGGIWQRNFANGFGRIDDLDKDGLPDLVVGSFESPYTASAPPGEVQVFSTGSGKELLRFYPPSGQLALGYSVTGVGDLDADGVPDILASSRLGNSSSNGYALVFSGKDGSVIHTIAGVSGDEDFGRVLCALPDMDSDGVEDFAVAAVRTTSTSMGRVRVFSGKTGALLFSCGPLGKDGEVSTLSMIPDMDSDKKPDLLVGISLVANTTYSRDGQVQVWSSGTQKNLWTIHTPGAGYTLTGFGEGVCWLPDRDGDQLPDVLAGDQFFQGQGAAHVFGSKSRSLLQTILPHWSNPTDSQLAKRIALLGDVDGNGSLDFVASCQRPDTPGTSRIGILTCSLDPLDLSVDNEEVSLFLGGKQEIHVHAGPKHAGDLVLMLGTASGTSPGLPLAAGTLHLNADSYFGFTLAAPLAVLWNNLSFLDANGEGGVGFVLPNGLSPSLAGTVLHHSALFLGPTRLEPANIAVRLELSKF